MIVCYITTILSAVWERNDYFLIKNLLY